jgi:hypothetical protein
MARTLTVTEAVREYDVHPNQLHLLIRRGRLDACRSERGYWLINRTSLDHWAATRRRRTLRASEGSNLQVDVATNPACARKGEPASTYRRQSGLDKLFQ